MNSERIKEIQETTAYPESVSVKQALLQVWNECEQEQLIIPVIVKSFVCPNGCGQNGDVGSCIECVGK